MPLPLTVSCFSKIQIGFTFLIPLTRSSEKRPLNACAHTRVCVCVWLCAKQPFGRLSCDFDHYWNNRRESVLCWTVNPCQNFQISMQVVIQVSKTPHFWWGTDRYVDGVLDRSMLLVWHYFRQWESFEGLADIPRMCYCTWVLMGDYRVYGLGAVPPPLKWAPFWQSVLSFCTLAAV